MNLKYSKDTENNVHVIKNDDVEIKRTPKIGFVVDAYNYPSRHALVIKHGDYDTVKKYHSEILGSLSSSKNTDEQTAEFSSEMAKCLHLIDVTDWDITDVNDCVENIRLRPEQIEKYTLNIKKHE